MNILYIPQLSMYDKKTGNYIPQADGNINMMRNFIREWSKYRPDDWFHILLPKQVYDTMQYPYMLHGLTKYIQYFPIDNVTSARINRYNFPMAQLIESIKQYYPKIDLIINDIPEISRNLIAMFEVQFGYSPKIISNIRHVDEYNTKKNRYDYFWRMIDGIECSDMCTILSQSMKDILHREIIDFLHPSIVDDLIEKVEVFEPSISMTELDKYKNMAIIKDMKKKVITFPGRLSKGEENRTNWDKFLDAIQVLRDTCRDDFEVYLTDPNNAANFDKQPEWLKFIDKDRDQFIRLLHKTDIVVSLMDIQGFGGISIREAILMNCLPVIPYKHEYKSMQKPNYPGYILGEVTVDKLVDAIAWALDQNPIDYTPSLYARKFTVECQMQSLIKKLEVITNEKFC